MPGGVAGAQFIRTAPYADCVATLPVRCMAQLVSAPVLLPLAISMVTIESTDFCLALHRPNVEPNRA